LCIIIYNYLDIILIISYTLYIQYYYIIKWISRLKFIIKIASSIIMYFFNYILKFKLWILNFKNFTRASETLHGVSFNFNAFYTEHNYIDHNWLEWFIGFTEGDGAILTSKKGNISFVITQNESKILYQIKEKLGFGNITFDSKANTYRYKVLDKPTLFKLALLFNGNLLLSHRINQLEEWIIILNLKFNIIIFNNKNINISLNDAWLSGFTDAEGCFNVNIYSEPRYKLGFKPKIRFLIDQNDQLVLSIINNLFNTGYVSKRSGNLTTFRYTADGYTRLGPILSYFELFPLKTIKHEAFIKWSEIHSLILSKNHLNIEGLTKIKILAKLVNDKTNI
jgi:hypothetical protein